MKKLILTIAFLFIAVACYAQVHVSGYYRKDGTYVKPHYRSSPNSSVRDNYSYYGNTNPYTGKLGTNKYSNNQSSGFYGGSSFGKSSSFGTSSPFFSNR